MKKYFILSILSFTFAISACSRIDAVPVYVQKQKPCNTTKKKPELPCTHSTRVVNYTQQCNCSEDFPVTVRKVSDCNSGDLI